MKKSVSVLLSLIAVFCLFSVKVFASSYDCGNLKVKVDDNKYVVITENNISKESDFLNKIGFTVSSFSEMFDKLNIVLFLADDSNSFQMQTVLSETDFSSEIKDLSELDEETFIRLTKNIVEDGILKDINGVKYIFRKDDNADFTTYQYVTVKNGKMYTFTFYVTQDYGKNAAENSIDEILNAVEFENSGNAGGAKSFPDIIFIILIFLLIAATAVVIIVTIIKLIKDIKKRNSEDVSDSIIRRNR